MKPWSQLTLDEQRHVRTQMTLCGGKSVNGVAGWYAAQRAQKKPIPNRKKPLQLYRPTIRNVTVEPVQTLTLKDIKDVLPN